jgi:hypothetical protein
MYRDGFLWLSNHRLHEVLTGWFPSYQLDPVGIPIDASWSPSERIWARCQPWLFLGMGRKIGPWNTVAIWVICGWYDFHSTKLVSFGSAKPVEPVEAGPNVSLYHCCITVSLYHVNLKTRLIQACWDDGIGKLFSKHIKLVNPSIEASFELMRTMVLNQLISSTWDAFPANQRNVSTSGFISIWLVWTI